MSMVSEVPAVSKVPWPWVPTVSDLHGCLQSLMCPQCLRHTVSIVSKVSVVSEVPAVSEIPIQCEM